MTDTIDDTAQAILEGEYPGSPISVDDLQAMARLWRLKSSIEADLHDLSGCWSQNPEDGGFDQEAFNIVKNLRAKLSDLEEGEAWV